jgi:alkaline phosphatase D
MLNEYQKSRRNFIKTASFALSAGVVTSGSGLSNITASLNTTALSNLPQLTYGIQFGDVLSDRAIVWSRADRPARMVVEHSFNPDFKESTLIQGPLVLENTDYTARIDLTGLPASQDVFVQVLF